MNRIYKYKILQRIKFNKNKFFKIKIILVMGLGIGDWGLGIGDWAQSPIPNPQSPIPNPHANYIYFFI